VTNAGVVCVKLHCLRDLISLELYMSFKSSSNNIQQPKHVAKIAATLCIDRVSPGLNLFTEIQ
jgi:hypothetical protein